MKVSDAFPSNYIKAADLQGRSVRVVMGNVVTEKIGEDQRPVLYFQGREKGLVLNKTNANNIAFAYGDDMDDWAGGQLELFPTMVDFQGRSVEAVRVRVPPRKPTSQATQARVDQSQHKPFPGDETEDPVPQF